MNIYTPLVNKIKDIFYLDFQISSIISECSSGITKKSNTGIEQEKLLAYRKTVSDLKNYLFKDFKSLESTSYDNVLLQTSSIQAFIDEKKDKIKKRQSSQRFYSKPDDRLFVNSGKFIKRFFLKLYWFWISLINLFRRLFKADPDKNKCDHGET